MREKLENKLIARLVGNKAKKFAFFVEYGLITKAEAIEKVCESTVCQLLPFSTYHPLEPLYIDLGYIFSVPPMGMIFLQESSLI